MKFAEIKIVIDVDESKLTTQQQIKAELSNVDYTVDHPVSLGVELLEGMLKGFATQRFAYLLQGQEAVSVKIEV